MGIECHLQAIEEDAPVGSMQDVRTLLEAFFPETVWDSPGVAVCSSDHGFVRFSYCGELVQSVDIRIQSPNDDVLFLTLLAMARERDCVVINDGTGASLETQVINSERKIKAIQRTARGRVGTHVKSKKLTPKLPRIISECLVADSELIPERVTLATLKDNETSDDIFETIIPVVFPNNDGPDLDWHPMSCNDEIRLPDGRRCAVLYYCSPDEIVAGKSVMRDYLQKTVRTGGRFSRRLVILDDGVEFRISDCTLVSRAPGRGRMA